MCSFKGSGRLNSVIILQPLCLITGFGKNMVDCDETTAAKNITSTA
jgi:hypothetical protein